MAAVVLGALLLLQAGGAAAGEVRGRVSLRVDGVRLADLGPVVVFLEGADGRIPFEPPGHTPRIHQKNATFSPSFLVVAAGQTVAMPNDDVIFHNVFSYSKPNRFDLGLFPKGSSRSVTLRPDISSFSRTEPLMSVNTNVLSSAIRGRMSVWRRRKKKGVGFAYHAATPI